MRGRAPQWRALGNPQLNKQSVSWSTDSAQRPSVQAQDRARLPACIKRLALMATLLPRKAGILSHDPSLTTERTVPSSDSLWRPHKGKSQAVARG